MINDEFQAQCELAAYGGGRVKFSRQAFEFNEIFLLRFFIEWKK